MALEATLTDDRSRGFTRGVEPLRYAGVTLDAQEAHSTALQWLRPRARVLDVGCGTGDFSRIMNERLGCEVVGIEPNDERATCAESNGVQVCRGYLGASLAPTLGTFDFVLFMDVLEHVADPVELLTEARGFLREGGQVVLSVPNVAHWTVRLKLLTGRFDYRPTGIMDATHLRWFTMRTIREVVESAGFEVMQQTVSRGAWMPAYHVRFPWKLLNARQRQRALDRLCSWRPGLFGCQHLVMAQPR